MTALVAYMRKQLLIFNVIIKNYRLWKQTAI